MTLKEILDQLNIVGQCKKYRVPLSQCPQFLFVVMGLIIILAMLISYFIGVRYIEEPEVVALMVIGITLILLIIGFSITRSFERLAEASRMKTEFISIVSHQLRAPLSNMRWSIELLMSGKLNGLREKQLEHFRVLAENSARMRELINKLLTVSRLETGRFPMKKGEVSLEELVKEVISEYKLFAEASNVEVKFESEKDLPKVFTDPEQLKIVIENLLHNAISYCFEKGKVEIKLKRVKNNLYFEISDNGVGIPEPDQKYIFQKFFRAENILRYQTQGSGLGLFITKSILDRLGGKIAFKSQEGVGSTFWFYLPIK